ncbi:MAG TPA: XRE family transcriptional regulator [Planctomycetota bacterium]|nr:XRE family transcriptional regulator [Planctomycetota bacterium]
MDDPVAQRLAANVKQLRLARSFTQEQLARISGVPRATWANLESGAANPTVSVLLKVAAALQVSVEELLAAPRATARRFAAGELRRRKRGDVELRQLLPDPIPGTMIERMELPPRARMSGVPHMPGTREYLTAERGEIELVVAGTKFLLGEGDVVVFRGDQNHSYRNPTSKTSVAYSVVILAPAAAEAPPR